VHRSIADKGPQIAELCRRYGVRRLEVFGSAARGQDFDPSCSDVDFLVDLASDGDASPFEAFFGLKRELEALLGRPVDLVSPSALVNPYVLRTIEQSREPVYGV
jgi:hypothetical protein